MLPAKVDSVKLELMKVPTRIPTRPAAIAPLLTILPPKTEAAATPEPLAPPTAMPVRPAVIAPLLVMPPVKLVTLATAMPAFSTAEYRATVENAAVERGNPARAADLDAVTGRGDCAAVADIAGEGRRVVDTNAGSEFEASAPLLPILPVKFCTPLTKISGAVDRDGAAVADVAGEILHPADDKRGAADRDVAAVADIAGDEIRNIGNDNAGAASYDRSAVADAAGKGGHRKVEEWVRSADKNAAA